MTIFKVYQARLSDEQRNEVNARGWGAHPASLAYANVSFGTMGGDSAEAIVRAASEAGLFNYVGDIRATALSDVFEVGNIGPESQITRYGPMTSMSVGNVVVDCDDGTVWFCDNIGWTELNKAPTVGDQ